MAHPPKIPTTSRAFDAPGVETSQPARPDAGAATSEDSNKGAAKDTAGPISQTTNRAYASDWNHFASWCLRHGADPFPPDPALVGSYIIEIAAPRDGSLAPATIARRLSGLAKTYHQRGQHLDRKDPHITTALVQIRNSHAGTSQQKQPLTPDELRAMVATLSSDLRGTRDKAILLLGYAGDLRRSAIVNLDVRQGDTEDGRGWIEWDDGLAVIVQRTKTGWTETEIAPGSLQHSCPIRALEHWLQFSGIARGPVFRRVLRDNSGVQGARLNDKHIARLIKTTVLKSGIRADIPEKDRLALFSSRSLRAGSNTAAEVAARAAQERAFDETYDRAPRHSARLRLTRVKHSRL